MGHNRKLVLGGVSLTRARIDAPIRKAVADVRNEVEDLIIKSQYLEHAPFSWISLILQFGLKDDDAPRYSQINAKHGDLPISIEVDVRRWKSACDQGLHLMIKSAVVRAMIHVGVKYQLPVQLLEEELELINSSK